MEKKNILCSARLHFQRMNDTYQAKTGVIYFYASAHLKEPEALCFGVVRACVRVSVCPSIRVCVHPCVRLLSFSLTRLQEICPRDFDEIFTSYPPSDSHELIRYWPYLVNFQGNGRAKYGKILTF